MAESLQRLQTQFDNLQSHHNTLLSDHEKLSYEFLQIKQDLEKLRVSYEDLQKERDSLLAQQISATQDEFVPPCLKCIEREIANSSPECSNASIAASSSTIFAITNSSSEDIASITDDAWLKELYTTGMYKSLKGHQTLCDVLKKQILNRNPRKEGIAFERKINADGTYWKLSIPKPHWLLQRDLQWIHPLYLALHVNLHILLMCHLAPTINCSKIKMVKYLLDMLALTAGTVPL